MFSVSSHGYFRKTSLLFYFISLSICNALQLLLSIFVIVLPAMEQFIGVEFPREAANLHQMNAITVRIGYPLMLAANYAAIWILTLICAQRFQAICHPSNPWKLRLACIRRSKGAVIIVVAAALGLNVIRFWEMEWHADDGGIVSSGLRCFSDDLLYKVIQEGIVYGLIVYGLPICLLLWLNLNIIRLIRGEQLHVQASRRSAEYRTALMTVCVFVFFFLCTTLSASIRLFMISADGLVDPQEFVWLVDLSNLLMNINALVTPIICFIFTRGFKDLFFVIRFAPPKGSFDAKANNQYLNPMLPSETDGNTKSAEFAF
ncbi:7 transmembrane receptor [Dictyocaulus viviparus]|uniref:7 transmembrane receptor n=1 Tax=Dictyocaulus viviparus TaxID=29172 RepID=A0A0D8XF13_DICVI|nr:7 transmembrane receptor [Dictyocaulus viviparus]